uniref:ATP-dependent DNA helicase n=1 Tax=Lutzomyia longipalpis TaxID=7200 RepID=A0A1B0CJG7_LUTLO
MILRNLDPPRLCNGTKMCVTNLRPNTIEAKILNGAGKGDTVNIPRIVHIDEELPFILKRVQFPVRLAFSITINNSQGQTLKVAGIDLRHDCFSHGQLYVAASRVGSPRHLIILSPDGKAKNVILSPSLSVPQNFAAAVVSIEKNFSIQQDGSFCGETNGGE